MASSLHSSSSPLDGAPPGSARLRLDDGSEDLLVREEPLLIEVAGAGRVLTMRTPGRDADLAIGFLLAEGVVGDVDQIVDVAVRDAVPEQDTPATARVTLRDAGTARIEGRLTRTHELRPSCGVCGLDSVDALLDDLPPLLPGAPRLALADLAQRAAALRAHQPLFSATGGSHAAAVFGADGALWAVAEDVGRHNALDKALGQAARDRRPLDRASVLLSGRAGYELVLKCLRLQVPVILSVSAPSALGVEICSAAGATLIGFVRGDRARVYCGSQRLLTD